MASGDENGEHKCYSDMRTSRSAELLCLSRTTCEIITSTQEENVFCLCLCLFHVVGTPFCACAFVSTYYISQNTGSPGSMLAVRVDSNLLTENVPNVIFSKNINKIDHFRVPCAPVSKRVQVRNLSSENQVSSQVYSNANLIQNQVSSQVYSKANLIHFQMKGFELALVLKQRQKATRKWPFGLPCVWCCVCFCLCAFGAILKRFRGVLIFHVHSHPNLWMKYWNCRSVATRMKAFLL